MAEVSTRPKSGKTKTARPVPVAQQAPAQSERDTLALQVAEILQTMYMAAAYHDDGGSRTNNNTHFDVVDHLLGLLLAPEHHERGEADPVCGDIHEHLTQIADELQDGASLMDERPLANLAAPMQAMYAAMAHRAAEYADRLFMAYCADSLDDLRHLTSFAGMRPFRDRPQPPIRRVESTVNGYSHTQAAQVFESIAQQAEIARDLLASVRGKNSELLAWSEFGAAQAIIVLIGSMADQMTGYQHLGPVGSWATGDDIYHPENGAAA